MSGAAMIPIVWRRTLRHTEASWWELNPSVLAPEAVGGASLGCFGGCGGSRQWGAGVRSRSRLGLGNPDHRLLCDGAGSRTSVFRLPVWSFPPCPPVILLWPVQMSQIHRGRGAPSSQDPGDQRGRRSEAGGGGCVRTQPTGSPVLYSELPVSFNAFITKGTQRRPASLFVQWLCSPLG